MKRKFNYFTFIKTLISFSPRQLEGEEKTANFIVNFLERQNIKYHSQQFFTKVPKIEKSALKANGKTIPCLGCCFVGGKIKGKEYLISSLIPSEFLPDKSNINFNPKSSAISCSSFYFAPALAISQNKLPLIFKAKRVRGKVLVNCQKYRTVNILVGNKKNPQVICFAHYDSLGKGAVDNASGIAIMMAVILTQPERLTKNLFVFSANEELSYDKPIYWGHGFRVFEKKYKKILEKTKKIIVLDSLGNGKTQIRQDENSRYLAFPIKNRKRWKKKTFILIGDIERLMSVYHSEADDLSELKLKYLKKATEKFLTLLF